MYKRWTYSLMNIMLLQRQCRPALPPISPSRSSFTITPVPCSSTFFVLQSPGSTFLLLAVMTDFSNVDFHISLQLKYAGIHLYPLTQKACFVLYNVCTVHMPGWSRLPKLYVYYSLGQPAHAISSINSIFGASMIKATHLISIRDFAP